MALTGSLTVLAAILAWFGVPRFGVLGFLVSALVLFAIHVLFLTLSGFEGSSWEDSLLLFNGSAAAFIGFNAQVAYRALALPLFVLGLVSIWRIRGRMDA